MVGSPLARQVVALGLALAAVALSLAYPLRGYVQQQAAERAAVAEQQELEQRIQDLNAQVDALKDPAYIRAEAKRRLQYVTPGDTVYVVKLPAGVAAPTDGEAVAGAAPDAAADPDAATPDADSGQVQDAPWYESLWGTLTGGGGATTGSTGDTVTDGGTTGTGASDGAAAQESTSESTSTAQESSSTAQQDGGR